MKKNAFWTAVFSMVGLTVWLGFFQKRADFESFLLAFGLFFAVFWWILKTETEALGAFSASKNAIEKGMLVQLFWLGLFLRFLLLFSEPNLSEDVWRFVWDGNLSLHGRDPFLQTPRELFHGGGVKASLIQVFEKLNSKDFHTVYPPVCQAVFEGAAGVGWILGSHAATIISIKFFLFCCEVGTGWLLFRGFRKLAAGSFLIYWLNPLAILEVVGNCHFEGAAVFFMVFGLFLIQKKGDLARRRPSSGAFRVADAHALAAFFSSKKKWIAFSGAWALAICSKLMPVLFLPFFVRKMGGLGGFLKMTAVVGAICAGLFWPFFDLKRLENMASSLDLYFRAFEINASLYYIGRAVGFAATGWNEIAWLGPAFGAAGAAMILGLAAAVFLRKMRLADGLVLAAAAHLFFSTTVHAWYVLPLLVFSVFSKRWRLFPFAWSGLVALSYSHYWNGAFSEQYILIAVEYLGIVAATFLDARKKS